MSVGPAAVRWRLRDRLCLLDDDLLHRPVVVTDQVAPAVAGGRGGDGAGDDQGGHRGGHDDAAHGRGGSAHGYSSVRAAARLNERAGPEVTRPPSRWVSERRRPEGGVDEVAARHVALEGEGDRADRVAGVVVHGRGHAREARGDLAVLDGVAALPGLGQHGAQPLGDAGPVPWRSTKAERSG